MPNHLPTVLCLVAPALAATLIAVSCTRASQTSLDGANPTVQERGRPPQVGPEVMQQMMADRTVRPLCLAISPDGGTLAAACTNRLVYLLAPFSGQQRMTLSGVQLGYIRGLAFLPGTKTIAAISDDKQLRLWDTDSGKLLKTRLALRDQDEAGLPPLLPTSLAVSPDGGLIALAGAGTADRSGIIRLDDKSFFEIRVYDAKTDDLKWSHIARRGFLNRLAFSPDCKTLAGDTSADVRLWDAKTGKLNQVLEQEFKSPSGGIWDITFSPGNQHMAGYGTALVEGKRKSWLTLWNLPSGAILHSTEAGEFSGATAPGTLAFSPDGKSLATACTAIASGPISILGNNVRIGDKVINHVKLWDVATGSLKWKSPPGDYGLVASLVFSPDGLSVYCCDLSAVSRIDTRTGQTRKDLMCPANDPPK